MGGEIDRVSAHFQEEDFVNGRLPSENDSVRARRDVARAIINVAQASRL